MLLAATLSMPALAADNVLNNEEKAQGWQLLFNGTDMSQWRNFKKADLSDKWQIEDGAMKLTSGGGGDILTKKQYQNFELLLDWKIAEVGNSGIFVLVDETGNTIYAHAPEIQILDNERHSDNKLDTHRSGSLYDMIASPPSSHKKAGEWNTTKIRLQNSKLTIWQNGVQTAEVTIDSPEWHKLLAASKFVKWEGFAKAKTGHIGLQDHGDQVWFKNIKIKELN
ncbi:glycosyl hydrolase [Rheinheimera sp. SA_1]|nr:glycosyl hydrolase [Rheinheimera sp. SA_1]